MEMKRAGTLKVSKKTSAAFSLFLLGLRGASVSSTGCYGGRTESLAFFRRQSVKHVTSSNVKGAAHLFGESLQLLFGVNILPDPLHVIPVLDYTVLHRVSHRQQAPVLLDAREVVKSRQDKLERCKVITETKKINLCYFEVPAPV